MAKEVKMSGVVGGVIGDVSMLPYIDYKIIRFDCGGIMTIVEDFIKDFGYNVGDRVVVTISPCPEGEHFYPPKPDFK